MDTERRKHADGSRGQCSETRDGIQGMLYQGKDHPRPMGREENSQRERGKGARSQFYN